MAAALPIITALQNLAEQGGVCLHQTTTGQTEAPRAQAFRAQCIIATHVLQFNANDGTERLVSNQMPCLAVALAGRVAMCDIQTSYIYTSPSSNYELKDCHRSQSI